MESRILYLDDSGKPDRRHPSQALVLAGVAIDSEDYGAFSRRIAGAKSRFYPTRGRGRPQDWEMKSELFVKPNPWKRAKNRDFVQEVVRIMTTVTATTYSATINKSKMIQDLTLTSTMPLQLQCLIEHFEAECRSRNRLGIVVADWSSHHLDQHASRCVASYVRSRQMLFHPCVYYASSHVNEAIQVADLIAAVRRRTEEGDTTLSSLDSQIQSVIWSSAIGTTITGRQFQNAISMI
jgi:hypothetical protein